MPNLQKKKGRNVHGILLLDKPAGITSNQALQHIKRLYQARKAGHTGNLDKLASGLLPICLGEATKLSGYLLDADKCYQATCVLGVQTTTGDSAGEVTATQAVPELSRPVIDSVLSKFTGEVEQIPPMHSALKHKGQRLYKLAYQGIEVERKPRKINIYKLELVQHVNNEIELFVSCSKGTYIRTLAEDVGKALGCGAHIKSLRRTRVGPFKSDQMITMENLDSLAENGIDKLDQKLLPVDSMLGNLPEVEMIESQVFYIKQGQAVLVPHAPTAGIVRLYGLQHSFLGIGVVLDDGRIAPKRLVQT